MSYHHHSLLLISVSPVDIIFGGCDIFMVNLLGTVVLNCKFTSVVWSCESGHNCGNANESKKDEGFNFFLLTHCCATMSSCKKMNKYSLITEVRDYL